MKNYSLVVVILILLAAVGFGLVMSNGSVSSNNQEQKNTQKTVTRSNKIKDFIMTAKNWEFNPVEIKVNQGDTVKLTIKSTDVDHGFALPDFNVKVDLKPNQEQTVEFVADKKGEFSFFCNVFCGEGHRNMKGKLIVE